MTSSDDRQGENHGPVIPRNLPCQWNHVRREDDALVSLLDLEVVVDGLVLHREAVLPEGEAVVEGYEHEARDDCGDDGAARECP